MLARHVTFLTEETAIRIKNNIVQLVLTSNISRNTLVHTSAAPEQVYGAHQAFMNKRSCPDNFGRQNFQLPPPSVKVFAFYFYHGLILPFSLGPRADVAFAPPPSLNGPVNKSIGYAL